MKGCAIVLLLTSIAGGCVSEKTWKPDNCPRSCRCSMEERTVNQTVLKWMKTIECSAGEIESFPKTIPLDVQALLADGNHLQNFNDIVWQLSKLKNLEVVDMSENYISDLSSHASVSSVESLDISNNGISDLTVDFFLSFPNVIYVSLQRNSIAVIHQSVCSLEATHVKNLVLSENLIENLDWIKTCFLMSQIQLLDVNGNKQQNRLVGDFTFSNMSYMTTLLMEDMDIAELQDDAFSGLELLEMLDLDNNFLSAIPTKALAKLSNLKTLSLNGNHVKRIASGSFQKFPKLNLIELTNLPYLEIIDELSFQDLPSLKSLLIFDNSKLSYIDGKAFSKCPQLITLDAHHTLMETILREMVDSLPSLKNIDLANSPINCNCMMRWAKEWFKDDQLRNNRIICANPSKFRGSVLSEVPFRDDDLCSPEIQPTFPIQIKTTQHQKIILNCRAFGEPKPGITWILPDNITLGTSNSATNKNASLDKHGTLTIEHSTSGTYTCGATNEHGLATRSVNIIVVKSPIEKKLAHSTEEIFFTTSSRNPTTIVTKVESTSKISTRTNFGKSRLTLSTKMAPKSTSHHAKSITAAAKFQPTSTAIQTLTIQIINIEAISVLVTWSGRNLIKWFEENDDAVMTLIVKHNNNLIRNIQVKPLIKLREHDLRRTRPAAFNISSLYPGSSYTVCLRAQCSNSAGKVQNCTTFTTLPPSKQSTNATAMALGVFVGLAVFLALAIMIVCYWKNCNSETRISDLIDYEKLGENDTPIHDIYQPLIQDPAKKTKSDKLISTSISTTFI